jgi:hypothetical protein
LDLEQVAVAVEVAHRPAHAVGAAVDDLADLGYGQCRALARDQNAPAQFSGR